MTRNYPGHQLIISGHFENHSQISYVPVASIALKGIFGVRRKFRASLVKGTIHLNVAHISCANRYTRQLGLRILFREYFGNNRKRKESGIIPE